MYYISSDHLQLCESVLMIHAQKVISAKSQYSYLELTWCSLDKKEKNGEFLDSENKRIQISIM